MNRGKSSNVAASVRQRLLNIIRETGDDANLVCKGGDGDANAC
jgi:hypothetical protein